MHKKKEKEKANFKILKKTARKKNIRQTICESNIHKYLLKKEQN